MTKSSLNNSSTARGPGDAAKGLALDAVVVVSPHQVSTELGTETVILGVEAGRYFGLEGVGARVWELLQTPVSVDALCEQLHSEFEVTRLQLQHDVLELLAALSQKGLIDVQGSLGTP